MKISYNWLKRYLLCDLSPQEMAALLTESGLEVESLEKVESVKGGLKGVVVGEVITCEKHPNSDHLSLTTVNIGNGQVLPIVCGAPNVAAGQKVLVATVGTSLYFHGKDEPLVIKKAKIRGAVSEGMICAEDELGIGTSHDGIMVLSPDAPVGMEAAHYLGLKEDWVFEIGLTPNRTDAISHIGVARDLFASIKIRRPELQVIFQKPSVEEFTSDNRNLEISIELPQPEACIRYSGVTLSGIRVGESPEWLKELLTAAGIRPINNVVDVTNFVLMETGQPLHAFDADKITGKKVIVKTLEEGTPFVTLDGVERKLSSGDLMICNTEAPMCIGGVFGGLHSGVSEDTVNVFLESACFNPTYIRKTSRRHQLFTDASFRFERGSDPEITLYALKRAALLIKEIAGGLISSDIVDVYPNTVNKAEVVLRFKQLKRLVGAEIPSEIVADILSLLEYEIVEKTQDNIRVKVPTCRVDVTREADVIEDILRIYGYNNISFSEELHTSLSYSTHPDPELMRWEVAGLLTGAGFNEVMNNSLTSSAFYETWDEENRRRLVKILNPLSRELDIMRADLLPGLLQNIAHNVNRQIENLKIFEFGKVYQFAPDTQVDTEVSQRYPEENRLAIVACGRRENESWEKDNRQADFYYVHAILRQVLRRMGLRLTDLRYSEFSSPFYSQAIGLTYKKQVLAIIGKVSDTMLKLFDIKQEISVATLNWDLTLDIARNQRLEYTELPRFPESRRDLAILLDKQIRFDEIERLAWQTEGKILKQVGLFDIYEGDKIPEGKKSYALSFTFQDLTKTLTAAAIDKAMERLVKAFAAKLNAQIR
ncbi:MAG: phenylalanyl-tRNA synthetase beta chain [Bacteroidales bacterium]|jgi:phenylalanyl-tRNA synthetase beta chain|nr:phenylalanyl-tRNA synthetase beta chain [Bacteroidales bacterium]MDN5329554.1 phenylalanyl-tRNA synthetase beta chain [Bacteroidales bacterium]